jgi:hypothetical protein
METSAVKALRNLPARISAAPIYNYLARERRLQAFTAKLLEMGVTTVEQFIQASESDVIRKIRTTRENEKRVNDLLRRFGLEPQIRRRRAPSSSRRYERRRPFQPM